MRRRSLFRVFVSLVWPQNGFTASHSRYFHAYMYGRSCPARTIIRLSPAKYLVRDVACRVQNINSVTILMQPRSNGTNVVDPARPWAIGVLHGMTAGDFDW